MGPDAGTVLVLVRGEVELASWPVGGADRLDLALVDALARCQLAAHRLGCSIRLRNVGTELAALLDLVGLEDLLAAEGALADACREVVGQAEEPEQGGVEEVVVPDDPVA